MKEQIFNKWNEIALPDYIENQRVTLDESYFTDAIFIDDLFKSDFKDEVTEQTFAEFIDILYAEWLSQVDERLADDVKAHFENIERINNPNKYYGAPL